MIPESVVELSRWQFAITAMYHFLFLPLTLGLSFILAIMESIYVLTDRVVYKDMTKFWGKLFGINFAVGIVTGIVLEFQMGSNWAYFSYYVGGVFGASLAMEGLVSFFLQSIFVGMFFLGWDRLTKKQHLLCIWLVAIGSNLSVLFSLIANGWMSYPVGSTLNPETLQMEVTSFKAIFFNPVAQVKFIHTIMASYTIAAIFVLGISSFYLLKRIDIPFARRSFAIASVFGMAGIIGTIILGDDASYMSGDVQKVKLAAIEYNMEKNNKDTSKKKEKIIKADIEHDFKIPWGLGLIALQNLNGDVPKIKQLIEQNEHRIRRGIYANLLVEKLRLQSHKSRSDLEEFEKFKQDIGYGLLLRRYVDDISTASDEQIKQAARDSIPQVAYLPVMFWIMVISGVWLFFIFLYAFTQINYNHNLKCDWFLKLIILSMPLPWIAAECGWFVAEYGRQPWSISGVLPTYISISSLGFWDLLLSITTYTVIYTTLLALEVHILWKYVRIGPSYLQTGRYYFENKIITDKSSMPTIGIVPV